MKNIQQKDAQVILNKFYTGVNLLSNKIIKYINNLRAILGTKSAIQRA